MVDKNRVPSDSSFHTDIADTPLGKAVANGLGQNRGGRPRKDGTRANKALTCKELGLSKRFMTDARLYASVSDEVFEAALDKRREAELAGKRVPALRSLLPDRRANTRPDRDMVANISRRAGFGHIAVTDLSTSLQRAISRRPCKVALVLERI
jgi:hypothetical protein